MVKGLYITYRILGTILTLISYLALFFDLALVFQVGFQPALMPSLFLSACMVIYSVLSRLFAHVVIKDQRPMRRSLKDWIIVNAVVVILGLGFGLFEIMSKILNPTVAKSILDQLNNQMNANYGGKAPPATLEMLVSIAVFVSAILAIGVIHGAWTLFLVRRHKEDFQ